MEDMEMVYNCNYPSNILPVLQNPMEKMLKISAL